MADITPQDRMRHFMATVEDYEALDAAMPLGDSVNVLGFGSDQASRWVVVLHATLLRKYFAPRDKLELSNVVKALRACVIAHDKPEADWDELQTQVTTIQNKGVHHFGSSRGYGEGEILEQLLYGRYLHGDYDKWSFTQIAQDRGTDAAMFTATVDRAHRLLKLAQFIRSGVAAGAVDF